MGAYFFSHKLIISLAVVIFAILYREELLVRFNYFDKNAENKEGIFSEKLLAQYDGITRSKLYLSVLGIVFDVTEGKRHYQKGAGYNYFVGKDGSRSLVTGDFEDLSNDKDHVMDLSCNELFSLLHWQNTFKQKYIEVGKLEGRFYNNNGEETVYAKELKNKIGNCELEKENVKKKDLKYPPCNIAWSEEEGTKVWCTTSSGGIKRSWTGVPRQLYTPGIERPRCVCLNLDDKEVSSGLVKKYDKCPNTSITCTVQT